MKKAKSPQKQQTQQAQPTVTVTTSKISTKQQQKQCTITVQLEKNSPKKNDLCNQINQALSLQGQNKVQAKDTMTWTIVGEDEPACAQKYQAVWGVIIKLFPEENQRKFDAGGMFGSNSQTNHNAILQRLPQMQGNQEEEKKEEEPPKNTLPQQGLGRQKQLLQKTLQGWSNQVKIQQQAKKKEEAREEAPSKSQQIVEKEPIQVEQYAFELASQEVQRQRKGRSFPHTEIESQSNEIDPSQITASPLSLNQQLPQQGNAAEDCGVQFQQFQGEPTFKSVATFGGSAVQEGESSLKARGKGKQQSLVKGPVKGQQKGDFMSKEVKSNKEANSRQLSQELILESKPPVISSERSPYSNSSPPSSRKNSENFQGSEHSNALEQQKSSTSTTGHVSQQQQLDQIEIQQNQHPDVEEIKKQSQNNLENIQLSQENNSPKAESPQQQTTSKQEKKPLFSNSDEEGNESDEFQSIFQGPVGPQIQAPVEALDITASWNKKNQITISGGIFGKVRPGINQVNEKFAQCEWWNCNLPSRGVRSFTLTIFGNTQQELAVRYQQVQANLEEQFVTQYQLNWIEPKEFTQLLSQTTESDPLKTKGAASIQSQIKSSKNGYTLTVAIPSIQQQDFTELTLESGSNYFQGHTFKESSLKLDKRQFAFEVSSQDLLQLKSRLNDAWEFLDKKGYQPLFDKPTQAICQRLQLIKFLDAVNIELGKGEFYFFSSLRNELINELKKPEMMTEQNVRHLLSQVIRDVSDFKPLQNEQPLNINLIFPLIHQYILAAPEFHDALYAEVITQELQTRQQSSSYGQEMQTLPSAQQLQEPMALCEAQLKNFNGRWSSYQNFHAEPGQQDPQAASLVKLVQMGQAQFAEFQALEALQSEQLQQYEQAKRKESILEFDANSHLEQEEVKEEQKVEQSQDKKNKSTMQASFQESQLQSELTSELMPLHTKGFKEMCQLQFQHLAPLKEKVAMKAAESQMQPQLQEAIQKLEQELSEKFNGYKEQQLEQVEAQLKQEKQQVKSGLSEIFKQALRKEQVQILQGEAKSAEDFQQELQERQKQLEQLLDTEYGEMLEQQAKAALIAQYHQQQGKVESDQELLTQQFNEIFLGQEKTQVLNQSQTSEFQQPVEQQALIEQQQRFQQFQQMFIQEMQQEDLSMQQPAEMDWQQYLQYYRQWEQFSSWQLRKDLQTPQEIHQKQLALTNFCEACVAKWRERKEVHTFASTQAKAVPLPKNKDGNYHKKQTKHFTALANHPQPTMRKLYHQLDEVQSNLQIAFSKKARQLRVQLDEILKQIKQYQPQIDQPVQSSQQSQPQEAQEPYLMQQVEMLKNQQGVDQEQVKQLQEQLTKQYELEAKLEQLKNDKIKRLVELQQQQQPEQLLLGVTESQTSSNQQDPLAQYKATINEAQTLLIQLEKQQIKLRLYQAKLSSPATDFVSSIEKNSLSQIQQAIYQNEQLIAALKPQLEALQTLVSQHEQDVQGIEAHKCQLQVIKTKKKPGAPNLEQTDKQKKQFYKQQEKQRLSGSKSTMFSQSSFPSTRSVQLSQTQDFVEEAKSPGAK